MKSHPLYKSRTKLTGFTLIEIMIAVMIIGLLLAVAVPNFVMAREQTRKKACINNLRKIDWAKDCFLMDNNLKGDSTITETDIYPPNGTTYLKSIPKCDSGGRIRSGMAVLIRHAVSRTVILSTEAASFLAQICIRLFPVLRSLVAFLLDVRGFLSDLPPTTGAIY
jgi:prepilin-type N-terminal cleavage/methylation domain-containing protein